MLLGKPYFPSLFTLTCESVSRGQAIKTLANVSPIGETSEHSVAQKHAKEQHFVRQVKATQFTDPVPNGFYDLVLGVALNGLL